jgi:S-adenosylmethionine decarboxylase
MSKTEKYEKGSFGLEVILDLYDCDPQTISSEEKLAAYATQLCKLLKMEKYGPTQLPHFGHSKAHTAGYSLLQFIETSSITGHFSELWNSAYINIFSCKEFDTEKAVNFTVEFFSAKKFSKTVLLRK